MSFGHRRKHKCSDQRRWRGVGERREPRNEREVTAEERREVVMGASNP